jgi:hypothetical protein
MRFREKQQPGPMMPWSSTVIMTRSTASVALAAAILMHAALGQDGTSSDQVDPIALKLQKAKADYEAGLNKLKIPVLKELESIKQAAQASGDLEKLLAAKEAIASFEKNNKIPGSLPTKQFRISYPKLRDRMEKAFVEAKQAYTATGKLEEAISVAKDLDTFGAAAWDPRGKRPLESRLINVRSDHSHVVHFYQDRSLHKDLNANVELFTVAGSVYITGFGEQAVLCTHPFNLGLPATIDFEDITSDKTGTLVLWALGWPGTVGGKVVVKVDGKMFDQRNISGTEGWREISIPLNKNHVVVEHHAIDWRHNELMFFQWSIGREGRSPRLPRSKKK